MAMTADRAHQLTTELNTMMEKGGATFYTEEEIEIFVFSLSATEAEKLEFLRYVELMTEDGSIGSAVSEYQ